MEKYESLSVCFRNQMDNVYIDTSSIKIKAGALYQFPIIVPKANTVIAWSFTSKYYDILFSITKDEDDGRSKTVVPYSTYSHDNEHKGKIVAAEAGTYYLVWNNTASWLRERYIDFSFSLHFDDIEEEEKNICSKKILDDIASLQYSIFEAEQIIDEKKSELTALKTVSNQRIAKRELLNNELTTLSMKEQQCLNAIEDCKQEIRDQENHIRHIHTMAAFLVEDDRIFSFLDSMDILRLANVNRYLNDASHQDSVWKRLFVTDLESNIAVAVKNEWLLQKWRLFHPDTPVPSL